MLRLHQSSFQSAIVLTRLRPLVTAQARLLSSLKPSTLDEGFRLTPARLRNPFDSDPAYKRVLAWYLPSDVLAKIAPRLRTFGDEAVSDQIHEWISNAETQQPYIKTRDLFNNRYPYDRLVTSRGWKEVGRWGISNGVVAYGYEDEFGPHKRIVQHAFNLIYSASSAVYSCPVSMTSGAARLFLQQTKDLPQEHPFHEVYRRLTARQNNWISSQWMTERPGGSDVQNSETVAIHSPLENRTDVNGGLGRFDEGDYLVSGYKYFCSATDCDMALMLAKTESGHLNLFVAPTKRLEEDAHGETRLVTNGIRFHRLKTKMGTKELPTAELELKDVRAWRVGPIDRGIATIATLLNVTRTHNFITALSCWRRGMAISKNFARARATINQPLWTFPMHLRLLAKMETKFQGLLQLAFFTTSLLSYVDNGFPSKTAHAPPLPEAGPQATIVLRALTATSKGVICKVACTALQECQEGTGGVGYMDEPDEPEYNISRLYRDTAANMTWEGTTNVLSSEVVRHLMNKDNLGVFGDWVERYVSAIENDSLKAALEMSWRSLVEHMETRRYDLSVLLADGREIMFSLAWVVSGILLSHDSQRDGNEIAVEIARRWVLDGEGGVGEHVLKHIVDHGKHPQQRHSDRERINTDCRIVWSVDLPRNAAAGFRVPTTATENKVQTAPAKP